MTTIWVTTDGKVLKPRTPGELPPEDFDGYVFVRTEKDKDGNRKHIYKPYDKITTIWITEDGKVLKPRTPGEHPKEDFDGYEYVRTEKDDKGNIRHIYRPKSQVNTIWITEDGKVLKPRTPGEHPKEDFDGYEYVRTEKDDKGNIRHIYRPKAIKPKELPKAGDSSVGLLGAILGSLGFGGLKYKKKHKKHQKAAR